MGFLLVLLLIPIAFVLVTTLLSVFVAQSNRRGSTSVYDWNDNTWNSAGHQPFPHVNPNMQDGITFSETQSHTNSQHHSQHPQEHTQDHHASPNHGSYIHDTCWDATNPSPSSDHGSSWDSGGQSSSFDSGSCGGGDSGGGGDGGGGD